MVCVHETNAYILKNMLELGSMNAEDKQALIQRIARLNQSTPEKGKILWSRHSITELINENWQRSLVEDALINCMLVEDYPAQHRPLPDCLILGYLANGDPAHAVIGIDEINERIFMITVYKPSLEEWQDDWKTRK